MTPAARVLVAGVGNVLRGDDGFGPAVVAALERSGLPEGVRTVESGIGGMGVLHALMDGYDAVVIVDAVDRGGPGGRLYVLEPRVPAVGALGTAAARGLTDLHALVPGSLLVLARALGVLPPYVRIVGCQPSSTDELSTELSPPVSAAVPRALERVRDLVTEARRQRAPVQTRRGAQWSMADRGRPEPGEDVRRRDEILQIMFWLRGEGLGEAQGPSELRRLLPAADAGRVEGDLTALADAGLVERAGAGTYRLTERGRREAGRRFSEAFEGMTRRGHGACNDPLCACHELGPEACTRAPSS